MRYDRLLQLGGIDREVPPIPQYISKEELKEWQDDQEKEIPDGKIKGIKEVEDFLDSNSDADTLVGYIGDVIDTMNMDEDTGDITITYDNGEEA